METGTFTETSSEDFMGHLGAGNYTKVIAQEIIEVRVKNDPVYDPLVVGLRVSFDDHEGIWRVGYVMTRIVSGDEIVVHVRVSPRETQNFVLDMNRIGKGIPHAPPNPRRD